MTLTMTVLNSTSDTTMAGVEENGANNVKVIIRVRPPNDLEGNEQRTNIVEIINENILVFDPKEESSPFLSRYGKRHRDLRKRRRKDLKFGFDRVFGCTSSNMEVFEHTTKTVLDGLLGGYNCSVFAYGATGSGKTYTMLGNESNPGVIYHTMIYLYDHIGAMSSEKTCEVAVSYLEVYNEQIRDLLMPRGPLPLREDRSTGVIIQGLSLHKPRSAEELLHMLQFGNKNRTQHPTDANAESSRSHAVFQVFVRQRDRTASLSAQVKVGKMCLVDLAGSERATVSKNRGARLREGANINRSLLALGKVINSLADHKYKGYVPYRDSKLTRLLKDSLGGNCRTIMIAAVSPSEMSLEETYNTLKYADRAKSIRLNMKKNVLSVDFHVSQYGKIVEELRREITELKLKLEQCDRPANSGAQSLCLPPSLQSMHDRLQAAYSERRSLREQQLRQEISMRNTQWRLYRKHKGLHRISQLAHAEPENVEKLKGAIDGLQRKVLCKETERQAMCQHLHSNTCTLHSLQSQAAVADNKASLAQQMLERSVEKMSLEVEVNDAHQYIHHLRRLARAQEQEAVASETVITALLQLVQRQQCELQQRGPLSPDVTAAYDSVCNMLGTWGVSWAHDDSTSGQEGDQLDFQINSIINIPLLTAQGVMLTKAPLPGQYTAGISTLSEGAAMKTNSRVAGCPGRVVNGQVIFSATPATVVSSQPAPGPVVSSQPSPGPVVSSQPAPGPVVSSQPAPGPVVSSQPAPGPVVSSQPAPGPVVSSQPAPGPLSSVPPGGQLVASHQLQGSSLTASQPPSLSLSGMGDVAATPMVHSEAVLQPRVVLQPRAVLMDTSNSHQRWSNMSGGDMRPAPHVSTLHAGHTPNPKTLSLRPDHSQAALPSASHTSDWTAPPVSSGLTTPASAPLNGTFVVEGDVMNQENHSVNSTAVPTSGPSRLCLPVVDSEPWCGVERSAACTKGASVVHRDGSVVESDNSSHQRRELSSAAGGVLVSSSRQLHAVPGNTSDSQDAPSSTAVGWNKHSAQGQSSSVAVPLHNNNDENEAPHVKPHSSVRRAINFDPVHSGSTPVRVESMSYADAVRTPTPPRQPLQMLNCNSPQLQVNNLFAGEQPTPKSTGRSSMYIAGSQALDNIRRLKKLGMPSLVENLLTGNKAGGLEVSKPSYMLPTQAHARRVRVQSKDDCFNPRRVPNKSLAHSRSKSTTNLSRTGWKF